MLGGGLLPRFDRTAFFAPTSAACSCRNATLNDRCAEAHKYERQASLRGSAPIARRKGSPQSSALRLCRPPLRFALSVPPAAPSPRVGDSPPHCALLPPPSPGGVRHVGTC